MRTPPADGGVIPAAMAVDDIGGDSVDVVDETGSARLVTP
jgi:hypothetical protein